MGPRTPEPTPPRESATATGPLARGPDTVAAAFELSPTAVAVLDGPEHRYAYVNDAYRALARGKGELLGRTLAEVWPEAGPAIVGVLDGVFRSGAPFQAARQPFDVQREHGPERIWLTFSFVPMKGAGGAVERILVMTNEVTAEVRAAAWMDASHALTLALSSARTQAEVARTVFEKGLAVFGADAGALALVPPDAPGHVELVADFGYPEPLIDAWRRFPVALRCPVTDAIALGVPQWVTSVAEAMARYPDWAPAVAGQPERAWATVPLVARGRALGALALTYYAERGFAEDYRNLILSVAERCAQALDRARAVDEAREHHERLAVAKDAAGIGIHEFDPISGRITWDARVRELWGVGPDEPITYETFLAALHPDDRAPTQAAVNRALDPAGNGRYRAEYRVRSRADGLERWVAATGQVTFARGVPVRLVGTVQDVTERKRAEEALRDLDRRRSDFLAILSHELRNPLAPIRNALVLLARAPPGSDVDRRAREVLDRQSAHLARLVDDLLDLSRITHGKIDLQLVRLDAREVARRACDDVRPLFDERGVALAYAETDGPAWVDADPARLAQMIGNLLGNALKFTPPGGRVDVRLDGDAGLCRIRVRDTGVGIAPDELPRLFSPFTQAERTRARSQSGLGIGLALVQDLAQRHGGGVRASSAGVGRGAEFTLELPLAAAPEAAGGEAHRASVERRLAVLVAEDNEDAGTTLADLLGLMGHTVQLVTRGEEAIREALRAPPEVLVCDIGLPDLSGHEVVRAVRAAQGGANVFAIALTGYAQPEDREAALRAGFDAHMAKPPDVDTLVALLQQAARSPRGARSTG